MIQTLLRLAAAAIALFATEARAGSGVDERIQSIFGPIADTLSAIVFVEVPLPGGLSAPAIVIWLAVAACVFTVYFRFINLRGFGHGIRIIRGDYAEAEGPGEVSHFQALTSALSGTVGLGNIAGVAVAITVGGPGATFWMIVAGLLGMSSKFVECTLGVKYREVHEDGSVTGGPFRYLPVAFSRFGRGASRSLTLVFAVALFLFGAVGGNMFQANQTFAQAREVTGGDDGYLGSSGSALIFGLVLAFLVGAVIIGGITSIARVTSRLVPAMALLYLSTCLLVIAGNLVAGHGPVFNLGERVEAYTSPAWLALLALICLASYLRRVPR